jgi:hypothetical protein
MFQIPVRNRLRLSARIRSLFTVERVNQLRQRFNLARLINAAIRQLKSAISGMVVGIFRLPKLILITGPKVLLTSRISGKCAALMMMLCTPSLLLWSILTVPALLFQSPQQHAYFYFSRLINQDPSRWLVLLLAGLCAVLALAIPGTTEDSEGSVHH